MPDAFDSIQPHRQWCAVADEIAPPILGLGHVGGDLKFIARAAV
jgi:hypothetical protein